MNTANNQSVQQINTAALRGTREAHQPDVFRKQMTKAEWLKTHSDFKSVIDGQKYVLAACGEKGTCLVPVEILATKSDATEAIKTLKRFVSPAQLRVLADGCRSEEMQFFFDKIVEMTGIIDAMPKTYETDGQGQDAIAHLHYFLGDTDWYITERDCMEQQLQTFGLCKMWEAELGYICIEEITLAGAELDLYWAPIKLAGIK